MGKILRIFGTHDENTLKQLQNVAENAAAAALMADGHLGYLMPIGGVAAYKNKVAPTGVGFDIACGNAAIKTDMTLSALTDGRVSIEDLRSNPVAIGTNRRLNELADDIAAAVSFGMGRKNMADDAPVNDPMFENDPAWGAIPNSATEGWLRDDLREKARRQLGTVGSGNHYVDVFSDKAGTIWVGVHFGSRGLGHTIASAFNALAQGLRWGDRAPETEVLLDLDTPMGDAYWQLMNLAGKYAYAGREWVARKVVSIIGANEVDLVHNHHNFAWREKHIIPATWDDPSQPFDFVEEAELIVVRKGATPAFPGQRGFVGGSMGDDSVILQGSEGLTSNAPQIKHLQLTALYSTVHGAGRVMSRTQAAGKRNRRTGELKRDVDGKVLNAGMISQQMMNRWLREKGVVLRGGGRDEAPQAYRRLTDVLQAQGGTIEVLDTLSPLIVCMAGDDIVDPFKD